MLRILTIPVDSVFDTKQLKTSKQVSNTFHVNQKKQTHLEY